ncbi:divalent-cation tolerance protein CutA [bacterium]|nr:divalent-cation tolerance protein CutA [bacterium]
MKYRLGYLTTKDRNEAEKIGRTLVEKRLAACANILPAMHSIYRWKEEVETADECVLLIKTTQKQEETIQTVVKALHSYECPCLVFLPLEGGSPAFLEWIGANVG